MLYSAPSYAMGAAEAGAVTPAEKAQAEAAIRKMRRALKGWLKYRMLNNAAAAGQIAAKVPPGIAKKIVSESRDWALEQRIATRLHALLSEMFDAQTLPNPDVSRDPDAAVKLAQIAISGRLPSESAAPAAQGLIWLWPAVVVVGLVLVTLMFKIRSDAALAEERERMECIKMGACTDYGFWLKLGGITVAVWLAWDKFGLREAVGRLRKKAAGT